MRQVCDNLTISNGIRSGRFTFVVGRSRTAGQLVRHNVITKLHQASDSFTCERTILFAFVNSNATTILAVLPIFPALNTPGYIDFMIEFSSRDLVDGPERLMFAGWRYTATLNRKFSTTFGSPEICLHTELEMFVIEIFLLFPKIFNVKCTHCGVLDGAIIPYADDNSINPWRKKKSEERIYIDLVFPNSSRIFGLDISTQFTFPFFDSHITTKSHIFVPQAKKSGHYFITCAPIFELGALSLAGYISAFEYPTWACIILVSLTS